jgi:hypothetical protein
MLIGLCLTTFTIHGNLRGVLAISINLEKLEKGRILKEGWLKYPVGLARSGALDVRFGSTSPDSIKQAAQQLLCVCP